MNCNCNVCQPSTNNSSIIYKRPFVEVHAHSSYSLLDGTSKFKDYVKKLKELGHPGMALTDHGSACGTFQFYKELKSNGLKPIVGCEFYTVLDKELRVPQAKREVEYKDCHQSVYIQNAEGYINYNHLHYLANTEGYYYKPRVTFEELFHYNEGLIVTTGCMVNIVNQLLAAGKQRECEEWFKKYLGVFGDRFYGEIQFNEIYDKAKFGVDQKETNNKIIELCNKYDVPVLIGGDIHYVEKGDDRLQDIVINVARGNDSGAESFIHARHLYFHDSEWIFKMNKEWGYNHCESFITECLDNSVALLDKINFEFDTKTDRYPKYQLTKTTSYEELKDLAEDGLYNRIVERKSRGEKFPKAKIQEYTERLNLELQVIKDKGYEDYFLIYQDLIKETLKAGYRVGPGRGCFTPKMRVVLSNGNYKEISEIEINDKIKNRYNKETKVKNIFVYDINEELVELEFENNIIIQCTKDHEFLTENRGWVKADEINENDEIVYLSMELTKDLPHNDGNIQDDKFD